MLLFSWDNLSTKGALHVAPDRMFVWNARQVREAEELHGYPSSQVTVVGAHGATIPDDAEPADLTRFTYQCRIGPSGQAIRALMATLPEQHVPLWAGKVSSY